MCAYKTGDIYYNGDPQSYDDLGEVAHYFITGCRFEEEKRFFKNVKKSLGNDKEITYDSVTELFSSKINNLLNKNQFVSKGLKFSAIEYKDKTSDKNLFVMVSSIDYALLLEDLNDKNKTVSVMFFTSGSDEPKKFNMNCTMFKKNFINAKNIIKIYETKDILDFWKNWLKANIKIP